MIPGLPILSFESELLDLECTWSFSAIIKLHACLEDDANSLDAAARRTPIEPLLYLDGDNVWPLLVGVISPNVLREFKRSSSKDRLLLLLISAKGLPGIRIGDFGAKDNLKGDLGADDNLKGDLGAEERANEIG